MRVAIYQPQYFPRLHYINRMLDVDAFVVLESAQYTKRLSHETPNGRRQHKSYQSHAPIKNASGEHLLSIPLRKGGRAPINAVAIDYGQKWQAQHLRSLDLGYRRADAFEQRIDDVTRIVERRHDSLAELNLATMLWALNVLLELGLDVDELNLERVNARLQQQRTVRLRQVLLDHQTGVERPEGRQMGAFWTAGICRALGADEYLYGGTAAAGYMDEDVYAERGVRLVQQDWRGPEYPQQFNDRVGFRPNLSILDLLLNVRSAEARDVVWPPRGQPITTGGGDHRAPGG